MMGIKQINVPTIQINEPRRELSNKMYEIINVAIANATPTA